ncbi:MAG: hypothetical protein ACI89X_002792 [Planctomycetota bacterium]|jgi:hypothetical protein
MQFADPKQPNDSPSGYSRKERPFWRRLLFAAAAGTVIAATRPWTRVEFTTLFGEVFGPPAWQSTTAGFTCLCTSALLAVMALAESQTRSARDAVRPASLLLAVIMTLAVVMYIARGPGTLRGVSATWTLSLYIGVATSLMVLAACAVRFAAMQPQRKRKPGT